MRQVAQLMTKVTALVGHGLLAVTVSSCSNSGMLFHPELQAPLRTEVPSVAVGAAAGRAGVVGSAPARPAAGGAGVVDSAPARPAVGSAAVVSPAARGPAVTQRSSAGSRLVGPAPVGRSAAAVPMDSAPVRLPPAGPAPVSTTRVGRVSVDTGAQSTSSSSGETIVPVPNGDLLPPGEPGSISVFRSPSLDDHLGPDGPGGIGGVGGPGGLAEIPGPVVTASSPNGGSDGLVVKPMTSLPSRVMSSPHGTVGHVGVMR